MKHLFLLFLAVNIGLFIWGYQREQMTERKKPRIHADVGELRLLAERKPALEFESVQDLTPIQESEQITEEKPQDLMAMVSVSEPDSSADISEHEGEQPEQQPLLEEEDNEGGQLTQQLEDELNQNIAQDALVTDAESSAENLSELESEEQGELTQPVKIEQDLQTEMIVEPELLTPKLVCYRLGPIVDSASIEGVSNHLMQLGFDSALHKQSIKKTKGYWVMYPPQDSYEQAKQKLREIKKAGISDLWLFPKGEHKNAISLGLFSRRVNAEAANKRAQKKGLATEVLVRYVDSDQYWLEFQSTEQLPITEESRLALQEAYPDEKFEFKRCSSVVTE